MTEVLLLGDGRHLRHFCGDTGPVIITGAVVTAV
jgi:hypothetical protein